MLVLHLVGPHVDDPIAGLVVGNSSRKVEDFYIELHYYFVIAGYPLNDGDQVLGRFS